MPRKQTRRPGAAAKERKRLRQKLRRAQADLAAAELKRDRAQARVGALSIIVDEIRATLAGIESASELEPSASGGAAAVAEQAQARGAGALAAAAPAVPEAVGDGVTVDVSPGRTRAPRRTAAPAATGPTPGRRTAQRTTRSARVRPADSQG
jgi:hypothetical protein